MKKLSTKLFAATFLSSTAFLMSYSYALTIENPGSNSYVYQWGGRCCYLWSNF